MDTTLKFGTTFGFEYFRELRITLTQITNATASYPQVGHSASLTEN